MSSNPFVSHIIKKLPDLIENTSSVTTLLMYLVSAEVISISTRQKIMLIHDDEGRLTELYLTFKSITKPKYEAIIECLRKSGNDFCADILDSLDTNIDMSTLTKVLPEPELTHSSDEDKDEKTVEQKSKSGDYTVQHKHVDMIVNILEDDDSFLGIDEWKGRVMRALLSKAKAEEFSKKHNALFDLLYFTLEQWISSKGGDAKFSVLCEALKNAKCRKAAEQLEANERKIFR